MQLFIFFLFFHYMFSTWETYKESNTKDQHRWHHNHTKEIPTTENARIIHSKTSNMAAA
jgi:hypothetical protein